MKTSVIFKLFKLLLKEMYNPYLWLLDIYIFITLKKNETKSKTLLLIRLDAIWDYVIFRNYIQILKESKKYKDYKITLCWNQIWKELAEKLDWKYIDSFIFINRNDFKNKLRYRYKILKNIYSYWFETAIQSTYSREYLVWDSIVLFSWSKEKIWSSWDNSNQFMISKKISDRFYTKLIGWSSLVLHEFNRNKEFFESLINEKIQLKYPTISTENDTRYEKFWKYIVLFPWWSIKYKQWSTSNFWKVWKTLIRKWYNIVIAGSSIERYLWDEIIRFVWENWNIFNTCWEFSLIDLINVLKHSRLLISNDTSAVHIWIWVNCPTICIHNWSHMWRFTNYNRENYRVIQPNELILNPKYQIKLKNMQSSLDINSVNPDIVLDTAFNLLNIK